MNEPQDRKHEGQWLAIRAAVDQVQRDHEKWLVAQSKSGSGMPQSAIGAARLGGELAQRTLAAIPFGDDPGAWLRRAVSGIRSAVREFSVSGQNDEDNFGLASVGRVGVVLTELHQRLLGVAVETQCSALELREELIDRLQEHARTSYESQLDYLPSSHPLHSECNWFRTLAHPRSIPHPGSNETVSDWDERLRSWASRLPADGNAQCAARESIRNIVLALEKRAGIRD